MTATAAGIGVARLDERVPEPAARDELWHLARTFNTMLDRIRDGVHEQRRLVADASHELRTPLAAMRSEIDVSLRADDLSPAAVDVLESTREEVDRLSRLVDDLLTLATADEDGGLQLRPEPVDLATLAGRAAAALRYRAEQRDVALELAGEPAPVLGRSRPPRAGDPQRDRERGRVQPARRARRGHRRVPGRVVVTDEGPGVPPELRERIFDRFFRADPSRTRETGGSGLGLAIAREIARAHAGDVRVEPRDPGSAFMIELPAAFNVLTDPPSYGAVHT